MKIKYISAGLMLMIATSVLASGGGITSSYDKAEVRYIKNAKRLPDAAYQAELRNRPSWQNFVQQNGTWYVMFNEENARPHRAYGAPVQTFGATPQARALNFINSRLGEFQLPMSDMQFASVSSSAHYHYVNYSQVYQGLQVLNSRLVIKMTHAGSVVMFGADVFTDISISTTPGISQGAALSAAQSGLDADATVTSATVSSELRVLPVPVNKKNTYKLVYEAMIETINEKGIPCKYYTLVDAIDGKVLYRQNKVRHFGHKHAPALANTDVTIEGTVNPTHPYDPTAVMPLRNLHVAVNSGISYTDSIGYLGLPNTSSTTATFMLKGLWSEVRTGNVVPSYTTTLIPGTNTLTFDNNANIREISAYYHVNIVHDYMKTKFPSFTDMDNPLQTNVDVSGTCNAFYNGTSINFFAPGGGCNSLAQVGDVVYHEYGHGINDKFYQDQGSSFDNGAMGEGYADIWALGITGTPVLGIGFDDTDPNVFVRRYDVDRKVYPQDIVGEVHADGEIIAGAWWDTGLLMGNLQQMMDLFAQTFYATITGPDGSEGIVYTDILVEALQSDDVPPLGDNNISNGTPNDVAIVTGFDMHGISLLSNATLSHAPVLASSASAPVNINAQLLNLQYPWALSDVKLYYKLNRFGAWTPVSMTNTSGNNYQGTIPAQPEGTIIAYYIGLEDTSGKLVSVDPIAAADTNPNIPHFILNGFDFRDSETFDGSFLGNGVWQEGIPSDNATTGMWEIDVPVGSFVSQFDPNSMVAPDHQFTPGGVACAVTQNAASSTSALGSADVDAGETTLESPSLDLSGYTNPCITYRRWYTNNSGANPANDTWEVQISNNGTNWVKVERTNVSDKSWRRYAFRITDYVPLSSDIRVRFVAEDSLNPLVNLNGGSLVEAAIDDIEIYEETDPFSGISESPITYMSTYPNPASGEVNVKFDVAKAQEVKIELVNGIGQVVITQTYEASKGVNRIRLNTSELPAGVYMLSMRTGSSVKMEKVTIIK
jgi:hypothetical protein